ncbi:MAG: hypothetical protein KDC44_06930 [Phaeodactylibacter sp.]|nr:hypothetical protein [Phaeodactylibacter sp.]
MLKYSKWFLLLALIGYLPFQATAQQEIGLHFMQGVWQSSKTNPALLTKQGWTIALPGFQNTLFFSGPTYGDVIQAGDTSNVLNVDNLIANLDEQNILREQLEIETIGAVFGIGPVRFGLHHSIKFGAYLHYPKTLPQLIWKGNAQFIGQEIDLGHNLQITSYNEFALAAAFDLKALQLGARVKLLTGIGDISTEKGAASFYTDDEFYQLSFSADYRLNTSALLNYEAYNDFDVDYNFGQVDFNRLVTKNFGVGFDLGAQLNLDKLSLAASVVDVGQITWTENVNNYSANGTFEYDGLDLAAALTGDSISFEQALDTIQQIFDFREEHMEYTTALPTKVYLSGQFKLTDSWTLGALLFGEFYRDEFFSTFALSGRWNLKKWIALGMTYGVVQNTYTNIGLNAQFNLGPVQLYGVTDNIIAAFHPDGSRYFNLRAGLNLTFGRKE